IADGCRAVDVRRRPHGVRDGLEAHVLGVERRVDAREARGQYALAHSASLVAGRLHLRQLFGFSGDLNSSSGSTRIVAFVSSLICASQSAPPHQPAYTNAPSPSMISRKRSYVMGPR